MLPPILLCLSTTVMAEMPSPEKAVAYLNATRAREHIAHPYPMFYHHHVAPHAVTQGGKIFLAYQDENGRPLAMAYDIAANVWDGPRRVAATGLGRDTHGNPSLCVDGAGRIHVLFGAHGGPLRHAVSREPLQIQAWQELAPPVARATYPQTQRLADGSMALFCRAGGHTDPWVITYSRDAENWSEPQNIIDLRRDPKDTKAAAYCAMLPGHHGHTLHCFFIHKDDNAGRVDPHPWRPLKYPGLNEAVYRYNLYYVARNRDGEWVNAAGDRIELPITKRVADNQLLVYDSADELTYCAAYAVDADDRPYVRFNVGVVDWAGGNRVIVPWRTFFASLSPESPGDWKFAARLDDLRPTVQPWLEPEVVPVYDGDCGGVAPKWFVRHDVGVFDQGRGSHLFLGHVDRGWITRAGGPAGPPTP
jgi:hypothetical protein